MRVREVDERDVNVEFDVAVFRVHDILEEDHAGPSRILVYEISDASVSEVLEWTSRARTPAPVWSEVRCLVTGIGRGDVATVLLGTVAATSTH